MAENNTPNPADGNVTPPAGGTPPPATPPAGTPPPAASPWGELSPELKALVDKKQFKDPSVALEAYKNLESSLGVPADRLLRLPENLAELKDMAPIFDRLGRPKDPTGYEFKPADPSQKMDPQLEAFARPLFHQLGLTKSQAEGVVSAWNKLQFDAGKAAEAAGAQTVAQETDALKKEWGSNFDKNIQTIREGAGSLGLKSEDVDKLQATHGFGWTMKFLYGLGQKVGEANFHGGGDGAGGGDGVNLSPAAAQARIAELKGNKEWVSKYLDGDAATKKEMDRLHKLAYPEPAGI